MNWRQVTAKELATFLLVPFLASVASVLTLSAYVLLSTGPDLIDTGAAAPRPTWVLFELGRRSAFVFLEFFTPFLFAAVLGNRFRRPVLAISVTALTAICISLLWVIGLDRFTEVYSTEGSRMDLVVVSMPLFLPPIAAGLVAGVTVVTLRRLLAVAS